MTLLVGCVEVSAKDLVHGKHVDFILLEDRFHWSIAEQHSFVTRVLQVVFFDVSPYSLDGLWTRQLYFAVE